MEQVDEKFSHGILFNGKEEGEWWWSWGEDEGYNYGHYLNGHEVGTWIGSELVGYGDGFLEDYRREYDQDGNLREEFVNTIEGPMRTVYEKDGYRKSEHPFYLNEDQKKKYYEKMYDNEIFNEMNLFLFNKK